MKAEVDKLDVNELVKVRTGFNDLKTKVDKLDVSMLEAALKELKKFSNVVDKKVVKKTKKVNSLEKKNPDTFYNTDKKDFEKKMLRIRYMALAVQ